MVKASKFIGHRFQGIPCQNEECIIFISKVPSLGNRKTIVDLHNRNVIVPENADLEVKN